MSARRLPLLLLAFPLLTTQAPSPASDSGHAIIAPAADTQRAASPELEALTREVASALRCPVCQGLSINDSPSELAVQMKNVIRDQLAAGRTPDEVKEYFIGRYGEWVLLEPEPAGVNLLVYLLPVLALIGGGVLIAIAVRRWLGGPGRPVFVAAAPLPSDPDDERSRRP